MSQENVKAVRRFFDAVPAAMKRGDPGASFDSVPVAADFEWKMEGEFDGRSVWHGPEGFAEFIRTWTETFEGWSIRAERLIDAGDDRVVALTHQSATGTGSGVPVERNVGEVWEFEDRRLARVTNYLPRRSPQGRRA